MNNSLDWEKSAKGVLTYQSMPTTTVDPNSLGPEPIQISEIFGLVKATAATCVIELHLISTLF